MHQIHGAMPGIIQRPHAYVLSFFLGLVVPGDVALVVGINNVPIAWIGHDKAAFPAPRRKPVPPRDHAFLAPACYAYIRVVLLRTINVVGIGVIGRNVIKLRRRLVVLRRPGSAAIHRDTGAAIVGVADPIWILWINPEAVMIAMTCRQEVEGLCPVHRFERTGI